VWGSLSPLSHQSKIDDEREGERFPMIDVTCVDAVEGLYAVFMDEAGAQSVVDAFLRLYEACAETGDDVMCLLVEDATEQLEGVMEWREARVETMAQES